MSNGGLCGPAVAGGEKLHALIDSLWAQKPPWQQNDPRWSAFDIGNVVDLNGDAPTPAPTPAIPPEDDDFDSISGNDSGDGSKGLMFSLTLCERIFHMCFL
jgi:hypothetical protein